MMETCPWCEDEDRYPDFDPADLCDDHIDRYLAEEST